MIEINFLSMSKPKISLNMINIINFLGISEMCITDRLFKKKTLDVRTPETLISHLSTQVN